VRADLHQSRPGVFVVHREDRHIALRRRFAVGQAQCRAFRHRRNAVDRQIGVVRLNVVQPFMHWAIPRH
jgi:hypothetical protein